MMLRRIPSANLIPIALKKGAIGSFLRDKGLNQDAVFMEYLKELSFEDKSFIDAEACEERATIILSLVENTGERGKMRKTTCVFTYTPLSFHCSNILPF